MGEWDKDKWAFHLTKKKHKNNNLKADIYVLSKKKAFISFNQIIKS